MPTVLSKRALQIELTLHGFGGRIKGDALEILFLDPPPVQ